MPGRTYCFACRMGWRSLAEMEAMDDDTESRRSMFASSVRFTSGDTDQITRESDMCTVRGFDVAAAGGRWRGAERRAIGRRLRVAVADDDGVTVRVA